MSDDQINDIIKDFNFIPTKQKEQILKLLLDNAKGCYHEKRFIASIILAGIATEFAHRIKLEERGKEIKNRKWSDLIKNDDTLDQSMKDLFNKIREKYRNPWVHLDLKELEEHIGIRFSDPQINMASVSAEDAMKSIKLSHEAILHLYPN